MMKTPYNSLSPSGLNDLPRLNAAARGGHLKLWHVLGLALFLRILFPILGYLDTHDITIFYSPDTESYIAPAQELIANHRFYSHGQPEIIRTPGFPILLTAGLLWGHFELVTISLQILLSCFSVYMVYLTNQLLFDRKRLAIIAAMLCAIEPLSILYANQILPETLFTAMVMISLYFLLRYLNRPALRDLVVSGIALSISGYVRPISYFLPGAIAVGLWLCTLVNTQLSRRLLVTHIAFFLIVCMGLTALWQIRNRVRTGYFGFSGIASINMYFYLAASVWAAEQHISPREMQKRLGYGDDHSYFERHPEQKAWPVGQRLEYMRTEARQVLLRHPWVFARTYFGGVILVAFGSGASEFLGFFRLYQNRTALTEKREARGILRTVAEYIMTNPLVLWSNVLLLPLELIYLATACVVVFSGQLMRNQAIIAVVLTITYYLVISGGPSGYSRFREPVMPIICVLSAYGVCTIRSSSLSHSLLSFEKEGVERHD